MEENEDNKITCPSCGKTGNYIEKPNYCAYCGANLQVCLDNQSDLISSHNKDKI